LTAGQLLQAGQLSQADLARQMGVSRMAVSKWAKQLEPYQGNSTVCKTAPFLAVLHA